MNRPLIVLERQRPSVVVLSLNRPDRRNALSMAMAEELREAVVTAGKDPATRVMILRGAGPVFCAGLDLREAADPASSQRSAEAVARLLEAVTESPLVTIAAAHGAAAAGGAGLMAACDFVVAADGLRISFPEVHRGLVPALILTILNRQLKDRDLRELLLVGEPIDARRAMEIGLVYRVVPLDQLIPEAYHIAEKILAGAPRAIEQTKRLISGRQARSIGDEMKQALEEHLTARTTDEAHEGIAAFLEKRNPRW